MSTELTNRQKAIESLESSRDKRLFEELSSFTILIRKKLDLQAEIKAKEMFDSGFDFKSYNLEEACVEIDRIDQAIEEDLIQSTMEFLDSSSGLA